MLKESIEKYGENIRKIASRKRNGLAAGDVEPEELGALWIRSKEEVVPKFDKATYCNSAELNEADKARTE